MEGIFCVLELIILIGVNAPTSTSHQSKYIRYTHTFSTQSVKAFTFAFIRLHLLFTDSSTHTHAHNRTHSHSLSLSFLSIRLIPTHSYTHMNRIYLWFLFFLMHACLLRRNICILWKICGE